MADLIPNHWFDIQFKYAINSAISNMILALFSMHNIAYIV